MHLQVMTVIWITGLSGSGKSTITKKVVERLNEKEIKCVILDGDEVRQVLSMNSQGSCNVEKRDRIELAFMYSKLAKLLESQGHIIIVATISLFKEIHAWNRKNFMDYIEIFIDVSKQDLIKRDPKGIYKALLNGEASNVAGFDLEVDLPERPDYVLKYGGETPEQSAQKLLDFLKSRQNEDRLGLFQIS